MYGRARARGNRSWQSWRVNRHACYLCSFCVFLFADLITWLCSDSVWIDVANSFETLLLVLCFLLNCTCRIAALHQVFSQCPGLFFAQWDIHHFSGSLAVDSVWVSHWQIVALDSLDSNSNLPGSFEARHALCSLYLERQRANFIEMMSQGQSSSFALALHIEFDETGQKLRLRRQWSRDHATTLSVLVS